MPGVGCKRSAPASKVIVEPETPASPAISEPAGPRPAGVGAFVLYTVNETIVLPIDGSEPTRGEGLWIQDDRSSAPRVSHTLILDVFRLERMKIPECTCEEGDGLCTGDRPHTTRFDPSTLDVIVEPDTVCRCASWPTSEYADDSCDAEIELEFVSLVGGRLYSSGYEWNGACDGAANIYDALSATDSLIEDPRPIGGEGMTLLGCRSIMPDGDALWPQYGEPECSGGPGDEDIDDCGVCEERYDDDAIFMLRRGYLWQFSDNSIYGGRGRWSFRRPARPENCPSVNDPCGDPEVRSDVRTSVVDGEQWIATDGQAALSASRYDYRLYGPKGAEPHEFALPQINASSDVIGVRHHADAQPLLAAMKRHGARGTVPDEARPQSACQGPALAAEDEDFVDERGGRGWGNRCFSHIKAERWDAAEAACQRGLEAAAEAKVRGALLYNMGRIAEGRGDPEGAAEYYRESLGARPGNAAVRRRLGALGV